MRNSKSIPPVNISVPRFNCKDNKDIVPSSPSKSIINSSLDSNNNHNPYIIARKQLLNSMPQWKKNEILNMEATHNTDNRFYCDFIKQLIALAELN